MAASNVTLKPLSATAFPPYRWIVYWPGETPGATRRYRRFKTKGDAERFRLDKETELLNLGRSAAALEERTVSDAAWSVRELEPYGVTLREVVADFLSRRRASERSARVSDAVEEMLEHKQALGLSERYLGDLRPKLRRFAREFGGRLMSDVMPGDLRAWLEGLKVGAVTRNGYRRVLGVFFAWGEPLGYCQANPVAKTDQAKEREKRPEIFTPSQLRIILDRAPAELIPFLALGAFAGLRSAEIQRLDWRSVDMAAQRVSVDAEASKTAAHRYVPISETLGAWLAPHLRPSGPVVPSSLWRRLWTFRKALAEVLEWRDNGMRHSFASYALAREGDAARVALWLGHMTPAMTFKHYRERVTSESAGEWFAVLPAN